MVKRETDSAERIWIRRVAAFVVGAFSSLRAFTGKHIRSDLNGTLTKRVIGSETLVVANWAVLLVEPTVELFGTRNRLEPGVSRSFGGLTKATVRRFRRVDFGRTF